MVLSSTVLFGPDVFGFCCDFPTQRLGQGMPQIPSGANRPEGHGVRPPFIRREFARPRRSGCLA